jgi:predicted  nucleic acid-binding Zn-ribbon protein
MRERALHLRRANSDLNDELRAFVEVDDPNDDDDLVIDHVRSAGSAGLPTDSLPPRASDVENMAALTPEEHSMRHVEYHPPQPVQPLVDTNALAHALLAKVMDATREDKDWAAEVERLEAELAGARSSLATAARQLTEFDKQRRAKVKALTDELAAARETHRKLNETIAQVRAENESLTARLRSERRHRDNGIDPQAVLREHPALDAQQQAELNAFAERLMKQPPGPGGSE